MNESSTRTLDKVQQEYQQGALKAGHLGYQIYALQKDLDLVNQNLRDLNLEAASIQAAKPIESKEQEVKSNA